MNTIHSDQIEILDLSRDHVSVLASYAVSEVFACFSPHEERAIREVASEVGKTSASVGEHVSKLVQAGLLIQTGTRKRRSRIEHLYAHRALTTQFNVTKQPLSVVEKYIERYRSQMRLADRQHEAAQYAAHADPSFLNYFEYEWLNVYASPESARRIAQGIKRLMQDAVAENVGDPAKRENEEYVRVNVMAFMLPTQVESRKRLAKELDKK